MFAERLRLIVESLLEKQLHREVSVGKITGNVLRNITIDGISIAKHEKLSDGKLADIEEVIASYSLLSLLRFRFVIKGVRISQPRIWLERGADGKLNLPAFADTGGGKKKSRFSLLISDVSILSGQVTFDDKASSLNSVISGIDGELTGNGNPMEFSGEIKAQKLEIKAQRGSLTISKSAFNLFSEFEIQPEKIKIPALRLQLSNSVLQAKADILTGRTPEINAEVQSDLSLADIRDLVPSLERLDGVAEIQAVLSGKIPDVAGSCKINLPVMHVNHLEPRNVRAELQFTRDTISLVDLSANLADGDANLKGTLQLANGKPSKYEGTLRLNRLEIDSIISAFALSGRLSGEVLVDGTDFLPEKMDFRCSIADAKWKNSKKIMPIGTVEASLLVEGNSLALDVSRDKTVLGVQGKLEDDGKLNLSFEADDFNLEEITLLLAGKPSIFGVGYVSAEASMNIADPRFRSMMKLPPIASSSRLVKGIADLHAELDLNMPDLRLPVSDSEFVHIGSLTGTVNIANDQLQAENVALQLGESRCLVGADVQLTDPPFIDARLIVDSLQLENYLGLLGKRELPLSGGLINGQAEVHGKIEDMSGRGEFSLTGLLVDSREIELVKIPLEINSSVLSVPDLVLSSAGEEIRAAISLSPSGNYNLRLSSSPIDLSRLASEILPNLNLNGMAQIFVSGSGNIDSPSLEGSLELSRLGYNGESFGDGVCTFNLKNERAYINASLSDQTLVAILDAGTKHPFPFSAIIQFGNLDLEPVLTLAGIEMDFRIAGSIDVDGEGANPKKTSLDAVLQTVLLDLPGNRWANDLPVRFGYNDGRLQLESFEMRSSAGHISASGGFNIAGDTSMSLAVQDFDLSSISELLNLPEPVKGKLDCILKMNGGIKSPVVKMGLDVSNASYHQIDADRLSAIISYEKGTMELEKLALNVFQGEVMIKGSLPLDLANLPTLDQLAEKNMSASIDAENLNLSFIPRLAPQVLSANGEVDDVHLIVTGSAMRPKVDGSISLKDAYIQMKAPPIPIDNINGNLSVQSQAAEYEVSLDLGWNMDKGKYDAQGLIRIPQQFLYSMLEEKSVDSELPVFQFDMGIQNGQLGPFMKGMAKSRVPPIDGNFSGKLHLDGQIPYKLSSDSLASILGALHGEAALDSLNLAVNDYKVKNSDQIKISIADRSLELHSFQFMTLAPLVNNVEDIKVPSLQIGYVTGSGRINMDETFQLDLTGKSLHPGLFSSLLNPPRHISGDLSFQVHAEGKLGSPAIALSLAADNLGLPAPYEKTKLDKVTCRMSYSDEVFNVEEMHVESFGNDLNINGTLPVSISLLPLAVNPSDRDMDLRMVMHNFDLGFLSHLRREIEEVKGNVEADIQMLGTLNDPHLAGGLQLINAGCRVLVDSSKLSKLTQNDETPPEQYRLSNTPHPIDVENINLKVQMDDDGIIMDSMHLQIADGKYEAHGKLGLGDRLEPQLFEVAFSASPARIDPFIYLTGQDPASSVSGEVMVSGRLDGDFRQLRGKSILDVLKAISGEVLIPGEGVKINAAEHVIINPDRIYATLQQGKFNIDSLRLIDKTASGNRSSSISAFGQWDIFGEKLFDATVNLDMGLVSSLASKFVPRRNFQRDFMSGWLAFKIRARGQEVRFFWPPENMSNEQGFTIGHATIDRFEGDLTYRDQEFYVEKVLISSGENTVVLSGNVPMSEKKMELRFDARLDDMGVLSLISADITESSGTGIVGATITGNTKKVMAREEPARFAGFCQFENLDVDFGRSYIKFEDVNAVLVFDSQRLNPNRGFIDLKTFRGKLNDGIFSLDSGKVMESGVEITWEKGTGYRIGEFRGISVGMKNCRLYQPLVFSISFNGDLMLQGKFDSSRITGNIAVSNGEYTESLESFIQKLFSSREIGVKAFLDYPLVQDLELDVNVQVPGNVRMKNRLIDVEAQAAARVRGSLAKPIVLAQGNIVEGEFSYVGREFTITKGEIRNESEIDPKYDIVAETKIENATEADNQDSSLTINMELKGSLHEPSPPKFTISGGGLNQERTNYNQADIISILTLGTTTQEFLSRGIAGSSPLLVESAKWYLESEAQKRLHLKEFQIQFDLSKSRETRLVVAKQLIQDISVLMDVGYGEQQIGLEWDMTKHIAIAGKAGQKEWDIDLKIKRDFP